MLEERITELVGAINSLVKALSERVGPGNEPTPTPAVPVNATPAPTPAVPVNATPAPTAAPQYTLDALATAGSALIDAGKLDQLMGLLDKYGADSLTSLKPENYGAVAMDLRALGARI